MVRGYEDEGTRVRGYEGIKVRGYEGTRVRRYEGTRVRGYEGTRVRGYEVRGYEEGSTRVRGGLYEGARRALRGCEEGSTKIRGGLYEGARRALRGCEEGSTRVHTLRATVSTSSVSTGMFDSRGFGATGGGCFLGRDPGVPEPSTSVETPESCTSKTTIQVKASQRRVRLQPRTLSVYPGNYLLLFIIT